MGQRSEKDVAELGLIDEKEYHSSMVIFRPILCSVSFRSIYSLGMLCQFDFRIPGRIEIGLTGSLWDILDNVNRLKYVVLQQTQD